MRLLLLFFVGSWLAACSGTPVKGTAARANYAKHFRIVLHDDYTEIQLMKPENGTMEKAFALVKRGKKVSIPASMTQIEVPVKNMAALSTTHIGMLSALDALGCIKGTTDPAYISSPKVLKGIHSGSIAAFSYESSIAPEELLKKDITLIVFSGFGKDFPNADKLKKLGIVSMANYDWREEHPLGKAEWIKVFGYLTDQPEKAEAYFRKVEQSYNEMKKAIRSGTYAAGGSKGTNSRPPKVLVGSLIGDTWFAPAGQSYMARILKDAGANYIYSGEKGTGSCEKSLEQVYKDQLTADFWINPGAVSITDLLAQQGKYRLFSPLKKKHVYCYTHNSNYFWEMSAVNPHWILSDFAALLGTGPRAELHFYEQLN